MTTPVNKLEKVSEAAKVVGTAVKTELGFDGDGTCAHPEDLFERTLPADLTLDTVKRVQTHVLDFTNGFAIGFGEAGLEHLEKNADLASVSARVKLGHDNLNMELHRTREGRNPQTGEAVVKYGALSTKLTTGVGAGRGDYKRVQEHLNEQATSIFNK